MIPTLNQIVDNEINKNSLDVYKDESSFDQKMRAWNEIKKLSNIHKGNYKKNNTNTKESKNKSINNDLFNESYILNETNLLNKSDIFSQTNEFEKSCDLIQHKKY